MPRQTARPSGKEFLAAREPRPIFLTPEPVWVLDNYRLRRWYYRAAPKVGEKVLYLEDGFATRVKRVSPVAIYFADATVMRRPFLASRLAGWSLPRLLNLSRTIKHGSTPSQPAGTRSVNANAGYSSTRQKAQTVLYI